MNIAMKKQAGESLIEAVASMVMIVIAAILYVAFSAWQCSSKWKLSGMDTSYGPVQGCLVNVKPGVWIPEERIREIDIGKTEGKHTTHERM